MNLQDLATVCKQTTGMQQCTDMAVGGLFNDYSSTGYSLLIKGDNLIKVGN